MECWWSDMELHDDACSLSATMRPSLTDPIHHSTQSYISSTRHRSPWHSGYWQRTAAWGDGYATWVATVHVALSLHCSDDAEPSIRSFVRNPICRRRAAASSYICVWVVRAPSYMAQTIANIGQRQASAVRVKQDLISCLTRCRSETVGHSPGSLYKIR